MGGTRRLSRRLVQTKSVLRLLVYARESSGDVERLPCWLTSSSIIPSCFFASLVSEFVFAASVLLVQVTWKGNLKRAFPDPNAYSAFMVSCHKTRERCRSLTFFFVDATPFSKDLMPRMFNFEVSR